MRFPQWAQALKSSVPTSPQEVWQVKLRNDLHLARKAYHFTGVMILVALYQILDRPTGLAILSVCTLTLLILDFIRLRVPHLNQLTLKFFQPFLRREEQARLSGMSHLLTGALIVVTFFPKSIGILAFLFLAVGDPISSIVGVRFGKDKILPNKSLQGTMAGFFVCSFIAALYFSAMGLMIDRLILVSLIAGIIGAASELLSFWKLDDNFTIPVFSAIMLWVLFYFFGGFQ